MRKKRDPQRVQTTTKKFREEKKENSPLFSFSDSHQKKRSKVSLFPVLLPRTTMSTAGLPYGLSAMLKEGHRHYSGLEEAVYKNIDACKQLAAIVKTSMGPNGEEEEQGEEEERHGKSKRFASLCGLNFTSLVYFFA
jgi:hypothetical protein